MARQERLGKRRTGVSGELGRGAEMCGVAGAVRWRLVWWIGRAMEWDGRQRLDRTVRKQDARSGRRGMEGEEYCGKEG